MSSTSQKVVKNAAVLMGSQIITWGMAIALTVMLPRFLGAEAAGQIGVAISVWTIAAVFVSFGMDTYLVKEIARLPERGGELLLISLTTRFVLYLASCVFVAGYVWAMHYPPEMIALIAIVGLAQLCWTSVNATEAALQGLEVMHYIAVSTIVGKAVHTVLGLSVVFLNLNVYAAAAASIAAGVTTLVLELAFLRQRATLRLRIRASDAMAMLKQSMPYMFSSIGLVLYGQVDILIMSSLIDTRTVGWYSAARNLFGTSFFVPVIFITAIFPALSRTYMHDKDVLPRLLQRSFDFMVIIAVPAGVGLFIMAQPLIDLLYGPGFKQSGPVLAILGIVLTFSYLNVLIGRFLISTDRQRVWAMVMLLSAAMTVPLDLLFVPWALHIFGNGAIGGAVSYLITELGMLIFGIRRLPAGALGRANIGRAARTLVAAAIMGCLTWACRDLFIVIPILVGAATYLAAGLLLRLLQQEDAKLIFGMIRDMIARLRRRSAPVGVEGV